MRSKECYRVRGWMVKPVMRLTNSGGNILKLSEKCKLFYRIKHAKGILKII